MGNKQPSLAFFLTEMEKRGERGGLLLNDLIVNPFVLDG